MRQRMKGTLHMKRYICMTEQLDGSDAETEQQPPYSVTRQRARLQSDSSPITVLTGRSRHGAADYRTEMREGKAPAVGCGRPSIGYTGSAHGCDRSCREVADVEGEVWSVHTGRYGPDGGVGPRRILRRAEPACTLTGLLSL